jgi:hypothetical protein
MQRPQRKVYSLFSYLIFSIVAYCDYCGKKIKPQRRRGAEKNFAISLFVIASEAKQSPYKTNALVIATRPAQRDEEATPH